MSLNSTFSEMNHGSMNILFKNVNHILKTILVDYVEI